ncbi:epoxide hydrolase family protein [Spirillospora sp. NPDC048911]|uniref:epoxide hydrolase family protein n=1 Tax=Spirillospora sp. NPDC048911 TaxID=3364527 RepID=UPI003714098F
MYWCEEIEPYLIDVPQADLDGQTALIGLDGLSGPGRRHGLTGQGGLAGLDGRGGLAGLDGLAGRLRRAGLQDAARGLPAGYLEELAEYWACGFDWRKAEARLNDYPNYLTRVDGQPLHFVHLRSSNRSALPLLLVHDRPGTFVQYLDVLHTLSQDFDVVVPSVPGAGFSAPLSGPWWTTAKVARTFDALMCRLGYRRYHVEGSGAGAWISMELKRRAAGHVLGAHFEGMAPVLPPGDSPADLLAWFALRSAEWIGHLPSDEDEREQLLTGLTLHSLTARRSPRPAFS